MAIAALLLAAALQPSAPPPEDFDWMLGAWHTCMEGAPAEEHWLGPRDGVYVGASLMQMRGKPFYEFMRIARTPGGWSFFASPMGQSPPTEFKLAAWGPQSATFTNPGHDYPQRIEYRRTAEGLEARISGTQAGRPAEASWTFSAEPERC
jgi:hypothetical protein